MLHKIALAYRQNGYGLVGMVIFVVAMSLILLFALPRINKNSFDINLVTHDRTSQKPIANFPQVLEILTEPYAMAWNGEEFVIGNRIKPWGFVRIRKIGDGKYRAEKIPVIEPTYKQTVSFKALTWNGSNYIAVTSGSLYQSAHEAIFTIHDPQTLQVTRIVKAPEKIGCLAWDGEYYWAGKRMNTRKEEGSRLLYQLDSNFKLVNEHEVPMSGCQGLTWDGHHLHWADVFSDSIYLFDISATIPEIVHQHRTPLRYMSALAFAEQSIWVGDYKRKQLLRLDPDIYSQWAGGDFNLGKDKQTAMLNRLQKFLDNDQDIDKLIRPLKRGKIKPWQIPLYVKALLTKFDDDKIKELLIKVAARIDKKEIKTVLLKEIDKLENGRGFAINDNESTEAEQIKFNIFDAKVKDGQLIANWKISAGSSVITGLYSSRPANVPNGVKPYIRYEIQISGGKLAFPITRSYSLFLAEESKKNQVLLDSIPPGKYDINLQILAQYYTASKMNMYSGTSIHTLNF